MPGAHTTPRSHMTRLWKRLAAGYPVSCCRYFARLPDSRTAARNSTTRKTGHAVEGTHCLGEGRHPDFPTVGRQPDWRTRTRATARNRRKDMLDCRQMKHLPVATQPRARDAGGNAHRKARCARGAPARGAGAPKCCEANGHPASRVARSERGRRATTQPLHPDSRIAKTSKESPPDSRDAQTSRRPACREPDKPPESHATARLRHRESGFRGKWQLLAFFWPKSHRFIKAGWNFLIVPTLPPR